MQVDLLIENGRLATLAGGSGARCGQAMRDVGWMERGVLGIRGGNIVFVGDAQAAVKAGLTPAETWDAGGRLITPGLVDPHTHLVHAGSRVNELRLKLEGVPYLDILRQGGGILATVRETRQATEVELVRQACLSLTRMLEQGVTTVEAKSGYGLDRETELKQLRVARWLENEQPVELVSTFLGAHALPPEYRGNADGFLAHMRTVAAEVRRDRLAEFCDIFCEDGVFSVPQSRQYLSACRELGFALKLHADEIEPLGGAELAAELGAVSVDHVIHASRQGLTACAKAGVILVLLPGTSWNLGAKPADARFIIDQAEGAVALATDYNPGSCPSESLQLMMALAANLYRMTPEEILTAVTRNAAYAIGRGRRIGSLEVGKQADICVWETDDLAYIPYHFGINHIRAVFKRGVQVVDNGRVVAADVRTTGGEA
ncbi:imidazolonepropionase [Alicyclobacillus herbarius]|uniref:imidazolonepropionase n=1 Tax=Alicyclobacillus herbarius TaxID=122960 RepID=UPI002353A85E|nr:imidazolonepropionase [Alicyclobacillus herbarius]